MNGEESISGAPVSNDALPVTEPALTGTEADSAPSEDKANRDRLAQMGREAAAANRKAEALDAQVKILESQLQQVGTYLTQRQRDEQERQRIEREAYLASLPMGQRLQEEVKMLREELAATKAQAPAPVQQPAPVDVEAIKARRSAQILEYVNNMFDLGDNALAAGDFPSDDPAWVGEKAFFEAARKKAQKRLTMGKEDKVTAPATGSKPAPTGGQDVSELVNQAVSKAMSELGVGRPNSLKPAAGGVAPVVPGEIDSIARSYHPKTGNKAVLEAAKKAKENALANINKKR